MGPSIGWPISIMETIGIDVDGTVICLNNIWRRWARSVHGVELDLGQYVTDPNLLEFWKDPALYDGLEPFAMAKLVINDLFETGYRIKFISHCFEEHVESKKRFLNEHFRFDLFVDTGDKHIVDVDLMIDDQPRYLLPFGGSDAKTFLYPSGIETSHEFDYNGDWSDIRRLLL